MGGDAVPRQLRSILGLAMLFTIGCEPPATGDQLVITFDDDENAPPLDVDLLCYGECDPVELTATLTFKEHDLLPEDAEVQIVQYKVEYDLSDEEGAEEPPFYANLTSVLVNMGESASFTVVAVGQRQREWVLQNYGPNLIDQGIGTLALAGFDHMNEVVEVDVTFSPIRFANFDDDGAGTP
jgi:hypothetical protein